MIDSPSVAERAFASPARGVTLRDLLYVLFKHHRTMLAICLAALVGACGYLLLAKPEFRAEASVLIKLGKDELAGIETIPREQNNFLLQQRGQIINNEIEILRSDGMAWRVAPVAKAYKDKADAEAYAASTGLQRSIIDARRRFRDSIEDVKSAIKDALVAVGISRRVTEEQAMAIELAKKITITAVEETEVVRITFAADNADYAAFVANAYVDEYYRTRIQVHADERSEQFYEAQIMELRDRLQATEREIAAFQQAQGITNLNLQKDLLVREIAELDKQSFQVALAIRESNVRQQELAKATTGATGVVPAPAGGSTANYNGLDEAYFRLAAQQAELAARFQPQSRELVDVVAQQEKLRLEKSRGISRGLSGDASVRQAEFAGINGRLAALKSKLAQFDAATAVLGDLERQKELLHSSYLGYSKQTEQLRLSFDLNRAQITSVKLLSRAFPPILPASPKKPLVLALALAAGLLLSFAWAVLAEFFDHTFRDARDIEHELGVATLASLNWDPHLARVERLS